MIQAELSHFRSVEALRELLWQMDQCIARGMGRCYGDSSLNHTIISTESFRHFLSFDEQSGLLNCESGVCLKKIIDTFMPRGWFLPVTPGTKFITVGGAIASDVHGKNHHNSGSFTDHVLSMEVMLSDGEVVTCSKTHNIELFKSTCGGMGLTGIIVCATIRLKKIETCFIRQTAIQTENLKETMRLFEALEDTTYSVAWIDCLQMGTDIGRSILLLGEHASLRDIDMTVSESGPLDFQRKKTINIPIALPDQTLNALSIRLFNELFYRKQRSKVEHRLLDYDTYFYPLDFIGNWNRLYGKRGFTQYQLVLPKESSHEGLSEVLSLVKKYKMGSFLAVLKLFGNASDNPISFPMRGYTLTLDLPITRDLFSFLDILDRIVLDFGGRLYLTKDARMSEGMFFGSYSKARDFIAFKHRFDSHNKFQSLQSKRLGI